MSEETQTTNRDIAGIGERWKGWGTIASAIIAFVVLLLGGGFFYNEVWKSKVLTYTILPTYDLGNQAFTGLIIENRGRVPLTNIDIILSDLGASIRALHMPGPHEQAQILDGGVGQEKVHIQMQRLSQGASLAIYMLTDGPVTLQEKKTFLVSSHETVGVASTAEGRDWSIVILGVIIGLISTLLAAFVSEFFLLSRRIVKERKQ